MAKAPQKKVLAIVRVMHAGGGVTLNVWDLIKNIATYTDWEAALLSAPKTGASRASSSTRRSPRA